MVGQHLGSAIASVEAISVVFAAAMVWLSALVQHFTNVVKRGTAYVVGDRTVPASQEGFFGRATRTLANNVESALMWVPSVIVILILQRTSWLSQLTAEAYVAARSVFAMSYWLNIRLVRSLAWFVGMVCCAIVALLTVLPIS